MSRALVALLVLGCAASMASAGVNAGGTIFVHDPQYAMSDLESSYCGLGVPAISCAAADVELDGSSSADVRIWKCYAAFWNPPRLKTIEFGIRYPAGATGISLMHYGACIGDTDLGAAEFPGSGWPASDTGDIIVFQYTQTATTPIEFYWFAGYTKSAAARNIFELRDHPDPGIGGHFLDDSLPAVPDAIAGYGSLGFDTPGSVRCPTPPGACCLTNGSCVMIWQNECTSPDTWNGGPTCEPNPCPPGGACCAANGTCTFIVQSLCSTGTWLANVPCSPNPCPRPGACCAADGTCTYVPQSDCHTGNWMADRPCSPNPCPQPGACCASDGTCTHVLQSECTTGTWISGASCSPNPCPQPGACCAPDGTCTLVQHLSCTGNYLGDGIPCSPNPCPQPGACCYPDGQCVFVTQAQCPSGDWRAETPCDPNPCTTGACCYPDGHCIFTTQGNCATGEWHAGVPCEGAPCPSAGACCQTDGTCIFVIQSLCTSGDWRPNEPCTPNPCPQPDGSCCAHDGTCTVTKRTECIGTWTLYGVCEPNTCPLPLGSCCLHDGTCTETEQSQCAGTWTLDQTCAPNPCPQPSGSCCEPDGGCVITTQAQCNGIWTIDGTCDPNPCPPTGACCYSDGHCISTLQPLCPTGDWRVGVPCEPNPCPPPPTGACCLGGNCTITTQAGCHGQWMGPGTGCDPNPCGGCGQPIPPPRPSPPGARTAGSVGRGHGVNEPTSRSNPCNGTLSLNYDGTAEDGYCWQYGGIVPPYYGAFAECYSGLDSICGIELWLTGVGYPCGPCDLYVWDDVGGMPCHVLSLTSNVNPCPVASWPSISVHDFAINTTMVNGNYWVGFWANASNSMCPYFVAADLDGFGGCPFTNVAPGIGYPTGWQNASIIWGPTQALGIGAWIGGGATPTRVSTWGRIKNLYH